MTKQQLEKQIKEDFWNKYRTFTGRLATALSQIDPNNLLISRTIIWTTLGDLQSMTESYKDVIGEEMYNKVHQVKWRFPKDHIDIQQMVNELGLIIE
jgi:hypothetical protein